MDNSALRATILNTILEDQAITLGQLADLLADGSLRAIQIKLYEAGLRGREYTDDPDEPLIHGAPRPQHFDLGRVIISTKVRAELGDDLGQCITMLAQHQSGDWGDVPPDWADVIDDNLASNEVLASAYGLASGVKVIIYTHADRSLTRIALPQELYPDSTVHYLGCSVPCLVCGEPIEPSQDYYETSINKFLCLKCTGCDGNCTVMALAEAMTWHLTWPSLPSEFAPGSQHYPQILAHIRHEHTNYDDLLKACKDLCDAFQDTCGTAYCAQHTAGVSGDCLISARAYEIIRRHADWVAKSTYVEWRAKNPSAARYYEAPPGSTW